MRRLLIPLAAVALFTGIYLALQAGEPAENTHEPELPSESADRGGRRGSEDGALPEVGVSGLESSMEQPSEREDASQSSLSERSITGRVAVSTACASDPELTVFAWSGEVEEALWQEMHSSEIGAPMDEGPTLLSSAAVAQDMSFSLRLRTDLDEVVLYVMGRLAYSDAGQRVALSEEMSEAYLATECGACVEGIIDSLGEGDARDIDVTLFPSSLRMGGAGGLRPQLTRPDEDGAFVFRAVAPELETELRVLPTELGPELVDIPRLSRGETSSVRVDLGPGGVISGQVVDPAGLPIEDARVVGIGGRGPVSIAGWVRRESFTDADGGFILRGLPAGEISIVAGSEGFLESGLRSIDLNQGEEVKGLLLQLSDGSSITGEVSWPDGAPVEGALVSVSFDRSALLGADSINASRGAKGEARTDSDGSFRVTALGKGPFTVSVAHTPRGARLESWLAQEAQQASLRDDAELDLDAAFSWMDRVDGVLPDGPAIELVLNAPAVVAGRVLEEDGAALKEYELVLIRMEESVLGEIGVEDIRLKVQDEEGRFLAPGLSMADWRIYAEAEGFARPRATVVTVPRAKDAAPLLITLEPAASARGAVFTPTGAPAVNAEVTIKRPGASILSNVSMDLKDPSTRSDGSGRFTLEGLMSGSYDIYATADGYAPSLPLQVTLSTGEESADLRLSLRAGGTITGEIFNKDGELAVGATIQALKPDDYSTQLTRSDAAGAFRFENLEPGAWQVIGIPNLTSALEDSEANQGGRAEVLKDMEMSYVELTEGAEEHVILGALPEDPVLLNGVIRYRGEPVKGATLVLLIEGEEAGPMIEVSDSEGRYSAQLDKPGDYLFTVQRAYGGSYQEQSQSVFRVAVPKAPEHRYDIDLPGASITGRVTTKNGEAADAVPLTLSPSHSAGFTHSAESTNAMLSTARDGSFTIDSVLPGEYVLRAGGMRFGMLAKESTESSSAVFGQASMPITIRADERIEDLQLTLSEGGSLEVLVTDSSGAPVDGASLFIRDASGAPVEMLSMTTTNSRGIGIYSGLSEGEYQVSARTRSEASAEGALARVSPGATERVELTLERGTLLKVSMTDSEGAPVRAKLRVLDSGGREHAAYLSLTMVTSAMTSEGFSGSRQTIGPLPPGRYRIFALAEDGRETDKPVNLRGQDERNVRLRFR